MWWKTYFKLRWKKGEEVKYCLATKEEMPFLKEEDFKKEENIKAEEDIKFKEELELKYHRNQLINLILRLLILWYRELFTFYFLFIYNYVKTR